MLMVDSNVSLSLGSYKFFLEFAKIETLYEFQWEDDNHSGRRFIHVSVSIKETTHNSSLTIVNSSLPESNFLINSFRLFSVSFYIFSINLNSFLLTKITDLSQFFPNFLFHFFLVPLIMNI